MCWRSSSGWAAPPAAPDAGTTADSTNRPHAPLPDARLDRDGQGVRQGATPLDPHMLMIARPPIMADDVGAIRPQHDVLVARAADVGEERQAHRTDTREVYMPTAGFLGTRADVFVDTAIVFFIVAPFLMAYALRLAAQRRHREHRNLQVGILLAGIVAVLLLEVSIRFGNTAGAFAASSLYGSPIAGLFVVHLAVAVPTFIIWCGLAVLSWRRFSRTLPGPFGPRHRRWGQVAFVGMCLSSATGTGLYVMGFAL